MAIKPVALVAHAMVDEDDLKDFLLGNAEKDDDYLRSAINRATDLLERWFDRRIKARGSDMEEFHTLPPRTAELYALEWPILSVTSIHESLDRVYDSTTLVDASEYVVSKQSGKITRVNGSALRAWQSGFRAQKLTYPAGYTVVPDPIRDACLALCGLLLREQKDQSFGITGRSDSLGNFTRVAVTHLPAYILEAIESYRRSEFDVTGERDVA